MQSLTGRFRSAGVFRRRNHITYEVNDCFQCLANQRIPAGNCLTDTFVKFLRVVIDVLVKISLRLKLLLDVILGEGSG